MPVTTLKPPSTHREETPIRECPSCGAYLRSTNPTDSCWACSKPTSELTDEEVFHRIAAIPDTRQRQRAFEAYTDMQDWKAAA